MRYRLFSWISVGTLLLNVSMSLTTFSARAATTSHADELGAKAFLEDLMVRRYSQGLSTVVDKQAFSLGVQLDLADAAKTPPKKIDDPTADMPADLMMGMLDPEKLAQQFGMSDEKAPIVGFLATKRIKAVHVSVGIREDLGAPVKAEVEKWLNTRLKNEFGSAGKGEVTFVKEVPVKAVEQKMEKPKDWVDWLSQFQPLAVCALLALTILLGVMFWRITTTKAAITKNQTGEMAPIKLNADGTPAKGGTAEEEEAKRLSLLEQENRRRAMEEAITWTHKVNTLVPRIKGDIENIVRSWAQKGEEGKLKIVYFADAVGNDLGRLPIPPDIIKDVAKLFGEMNQADPQAKVKTLEKVYWDLVTTLNLGTEVLTQPFGFLSTVDPEVVNKVLMNHNPKLKTLVSLFLPDETRKKFVKGMGTDEKFQILENANLLSDIDSNELRDINSSMMEEMKGGGDASRVPLELTLEKVVSSLNIFEEMEMLPKLTGNGILNYKKRNVSLAFLREWSDDKLGIAVGRMNTDQAVTYLRLQTDQTERFISLAPPMMAEMLQDEIKQPDKASDEEKTRHLKSLEEVLRNMVENKDVDLADMFSAASASSDEVDNVVPIKSA